MPNFFSGEIARCRQEDMLRSLDHRPLGRRRRFRNRFRPAVVASGVTDVRLRSGFPDDLKALAELARESGGVVPTFPLLLAEIDGVLVAARSLHDGTRLAGRHPAGGHLLALLAVRAKQLR